MGRRARNKQGAPEPFLPKVLAPKKLGKRKADSDEEGDVKPSPRPAKKVKDNAGKGKRTEKVNGKKKNGKGKKAVMVVDEEGSADGWEDVEDDAALKAEAKCVDYYFV